MSQYKLRTISAITEQQQSECESYVNNIRQSYTEKVKQIEENFQAAALLDAAGIPLDIHEYSTLHYLHVELGERGRSQKDRRAFVQTLHTIREALGCRLTVRNKDTASGKNRVQITLVPVDWQGVSIRYTERLPRSAKCRIVTRKSSYRTLICEA